DRSGVQDVLDTQPQRLRRAVLESGVGLGCASGRPPAAGRDVIRGDVACHGDLPVRQEKGPAGAPAGRAQDRQPQQFCWPKVVSWDGTPVCGWSVIRLTPVSTKVLPAVFSGLVPSLANAAIAFTPSCAIFSGYCCEVAPIWPAFTAATPGQPPSTETIVTSFCLPAASRAA